ncbi:hypothetical protein C8Q79DRAFT_1008398 [Trametes meyenii]|nr:hypothetical protein C8Q79DRAFT_1008398 [Trametes meyenii]
MGHGPSRRSSPITLGDDEDVRKLVEDALTEYCAALDRVATVKPKKCTFQPVFLALADAATRRFSITEPLAFYQNVSPSKELRDASDAAETVVQGSGVESSMRVDVFRAKQIALKEHDSFHVKYSEDDEEFYQVTYKSPDWGLILRFAENPETRRKVYAGYEDRLAKNASVLINIFNFRREIANLLGYALWADYVTEVKMVKTAKGVGEFLRDIERRLRPIGGKDLKAFLAMKKQEHQEKGFPWDGELYAWDCYDRKLLEQILKFDTRLLREYFSVSFVVPAILEIHQDLFEVKFVEAKGTTWHPKVQQFEVWEKDAKDESDFLGYCYRGTTVAGDFMGAPSRMLEN